MGKNHDRIPLDDVDINERPSIIYWHPDNSKLICVGILALGMEMFNNAERIKRFAEFSTLKKPTKELLPVIQSFVFENMTDAFKIVTCFENYMKAILLLNGCLVHSVVKNETYSHLYNKQRKIPILISELLAVENYVFEYNDKGERTNYSLPGITTKTISIGTMFSRRYQKLIQLPDKILKLVKGFNFYRNNHHFFYNERFSLSDEILNDLILLRDFVNKDIRKLYDELEAYRIEQNKKYD